MIESDSQPRRWVAQRGSSGSVHALRVPHGYAIRALSDPGSREAVSSWLGSSPDRTLYHGAPYIDFLREQNGVADVLLFMREGNPLFALTIHSWDASGVDSGYSGVVFPPTRGEASLRRSVAALVELLEANHDLPFRVCQSAQAPTYEDLGRVTLLQRLLEGEGLELDPVYGRLCELDYLPDPDDIPLTPGRNPGALAIETEWLVGADTLGAYDPDARNQIRQAVRRGLTVEYVRANEPALRAGAYARFQPLHRESWTRTGLLAKTLDHWMALSEAVAASGGEDLVVLVLDPDGTPLAGVVCHSFQERALYWSGCSSVAGLGARANPLCLHGAILACRRHGVRTFELGRFRAEESSRKERAITDYKAQFGGGLVRVSSFSSRVDLRTRVRAARAGAVFEAKRRLSLALGRMHSRRA